MRNTTKRGLKAISPGAIEDSIGGARLLGNGRYAVLVDSAGSGVSWFEGHLLSKWDGDPVLDHDGFFLWIRDSESGEVFPTGIQSGREGSAAADSGCFEIRRAGDGFEDRESVV